MIIASQRPLLDNTQHSQQTDIHAPGGIRTHSLSGRATVDLRLRQRGHWDRQCNIITAAAADDDDGNNNTTATTTTTTTTNNNNDNYSRTNFNIILLHRVPANFVL